MVSWMCSAGVRCHGSPSHVSGSIVAQYRRVSVAASRSSSQAGRWICLRVSWSYAGCAYRSASALATGVGTGTVAQWGRKKVVSV